MSKSANCLQGLLQIIAASQNQKLDGRVRLQKEAYLLASSGFEVIPLDSFSYHHYGPFSRELSDALQFAVSADLVTECVSPGKDGGKQYSYSLSAEGKKYVSSVGALEDRFSFALKACEVEAWRTLELAATVRFFVDTEQMDKNAALVESLRLKPDTRDYSDKAQNLLSGLF